MEKTITIKLTDEEHKKFVEICNKTGKRRSFFVKEAVNISILNIFSKFFEFILKIFKRGFVEKIIL